MPPRLLTSLTVLGALCVVDWGWTLLHLSRGIAEANPLLAGAYEAGGLLGFSVVKLGAVASGLVVLVRFRDRPLCQRLVPVAVIAHLLVLAIHAAVELRCQLSGSAFSFLQS